MINLSTKPTTENALKMFENDGIERNQHIARFANLLDAIEEDCTIAIDGDWGSGKTFFAKQVKLILDACNPQSDMKAEIRDEVKRIMQTMKLECGDSHATVYYDAWANDNTDDPILSFIYEALKDIPIVKPANQKSISETIAAIAEVATGANISNLMDKVKGADFFKAIKDEQHVRGLLKSFIDDLIVERGNRLVIFIDELDRCKPEYAIRLLERIKHYFDDERVVFVFSVNIAQLQHTVKPYYGDGFDATRYLDKFFDLRVSLPEVDYDRYLRKCFPIIQSSFYCDRTYAEVIKHFRLTLRETERFIRLCKIAYNKNSGAYHHNETNYIIAQSFFIPIAIGLSIRDMEAYKLYITGDGSGPLYDILPDTKDNRTWAKKLMLHAHEFFDEKSKTRDTDIVVEYKTRLLEYYDAFFGKSLPEDDTDRLYAHAFYEFKNIRYTIHQVLSLLSPVCEYARPEQNM